MPRWSYRRRLGLLRFAVLTAAVTTVAFAVSPAGAQVSGNITNFTALTGLPQVDIRLLIIRIVQWALGFLGLLAVLIVMYGGWLWMTAAGNEDRVTEAKRVLINGLIGVGIIVSAFTIVTFIFNMILGATGGGGIGGGPPGGGCTNCSALGGGIIEDHYPARGATGVPRNTHLSITFKEPILVVPQGDPQAARSFIANASQDAVSGIWTGDINPAVFKLQPVVNGVPGAEVPMVARTDNFKKYFTMYPLGLLGSPDQNTDYLATVKGGAAGLAKSLDATWAMGGDYDWPFQVSTIVDTTPPQVVDVVPANGTTTARSISVVVTFSEAIDPLSVVVDTNAFGHTINFQQGAPLADVAGVYDITNGYRTVTFRTNNKCAVNSCGQDIFCFDANTKVSGLVKAATLLSSPRCNGADPVNAALLTQGNPSLACTSVKVCAAGYTACAVNADCSMAGDSCSRTLLYDGIVDMAGNSLDDGISGNGKADGPPADDYAWSFNTNNTIVKSGPEVIVTVPKHGDPGVSRTDPATATFSRRLLRFSGQDFRFYERLLASGTSICLGGTRAGQSCTTKNDPTNGCPDKSTSDQGFCGRFAPTWARQSVDYVCGVTGEACATGGRRTICVGGTDAGQPCPKLPQVCRGVGASCQVQVYCRGGANDGQDCTGNAALCAPGGVCPVADCPAPPPGEEVNDCGRSIAELDHGAFAADATEEPRLGSTILDIYQNCYEGKATGAPGAVGAPFGTDPTRGVDNPPEPL